ncbi:sulfate adenylyltransferase subunit CysD [Pseudomonas sp. NFXW11]|uniref:sulfate adenylyltransferase subunit CysD n=1 Tax=Pseudomonas sp. NFXW11 TaxID=2819531 RepID=UPI003CF2B60A
MAHFATSTTPALLGLDQEQVWDTELAFAHLKARGDVDTRRTAERRLHTLGLRPEELSEHNLLDECDRPPNRLILDWAIEQARKRRDRILFARLWPLPSGQPALHANDARGARFWIPLPGTTEQILQNALVALHQHLGKPIALFPHGSLVAATRSMSSTTDIQLCQSVYPPALPPALRTPSSPDVSRALYLKRLEAESIHIIREAVAEAQNPVMLYSCGKESSVMLHLASKAFAPAPPPFPLLHIDTRWKLQEMNWFHDSIARESRMQLLVHSNPHAFEKNFFPGDPDSAQFTAIIKSEGLKQALEHYKFDVILGGNRRDEKKFGAKERIFSLSTAHRHWGPENQRPELWNLYNTRKNRDERISALPLAHWTELDIWQYIRQENIPVVPLYFAKLRPVAVRAGMIMVVDDERCRLQPSEEIQIKKVRLHSLGCYPLTGAVESDAETVDDILLEIINSQQSGQQSRTLDSDNVCSMEKQDQQGYF